MRLEGFCIAGLLSAGVAFAAEEPPLRYSAPVSVTQPGAFVQLPLPPTVYAHSRVPGLADLRLVDARDERVPFALLAPRPDDIRAVELKREVALFPLPKIEAGLALPPTLDLRIDGGRLQLRARPQAAGAPAAAPAGWLFDLGERQPQQPQARRLRLRWSGPVEFSAGYAIELSEDLRDWRPAGGGQLMALARSPSPQAAPGPTQPLVALPADPPRFVRLRWADPATAPVLTGAEAVAEQRSAVALDPPTTLRIAASPEPGKSASEAQGTRSLHLDLGGVLDVAQIDLQLPPGTQVIPLWVQQRRRADEPWSALAAGVVYRIERPGSDGGASVSPPLPLHTQARYLRLVPDERAPAFDAARTTALVQVHLATVVFAAQGTPPYRLLVGALETGETGGHRHAAPAPLPGALPISTLVPQLDQERARFGRARLGALAEIPAVAQQAAQQEAWAVWRPRLLWFVLLAGVAGLGLMVWRLARSR